MGKLRSAKRHLNPLCVWRAKQKSLVQQKVEAAIKEKLRKAADAIVEEAKKLQNESQSKQEETASPSTTGESGNVVSGGSTGQSDPVAPEQTV